MYSYPYIVNITYQIVQILIDNPIVKHGIPITFPDNENITLLQTVYTIQTPLLSLLTTMYGKQNVPVILSLINTGDSNPGFVDTLSGNTGLLYVVDNRGTITDKNAALLIQALLSTGQSNYEHINNLGDTAILFACLLRRKKWVELLITVPYNPQYILYPNFKGYSVFNILIKNGWTDIVRYIITKYSSDPIIGRRGTPLL